MKIIEKITKEWALEVTKKCWQWLSVHPDKRKYDWFEETGWYTTHEFGLHNNCACCEYAIDKTYGEGGRLHGVPGLNGDEYCKECPLGNLWGRTGYACEYAYLSPYAKWEAESKFGNAKIRKNCSLQIVNGCDQALEKVVRTTKD